MSRTKRSIKSNCWKWKRKPVAYIREGQQVIYQTGEHIYDNIYKLRVRDNSKRYPYYTCTWDDIYPAALTDKWSYSV